MVSFKGLQFHKKASVYLQIINYIKRQILAGKITHYEEMPSRRELALSLSINPNTVQKAYKHMEEEGIITTIANIKSVVVVNDEIITTIREEFMDEIVAQFVKDCKDGGMSFQKVVELLAKKWDA